MNTHSSYSPSLSIAIFIMPSFSVLPIYLDVIEIEVGNCRRAIDTVRTKVLWRVRKWGEIV